MPVREQTTDANGTLKVHEQGTANVNVTNSSLNVASPQPITDVGGDFAVSNDHIVSLIPAGRVATASALDIHMDSEINGMAFSLSPDGASP